MKQFILESLFNSKELNNILESVENNIQNNENIVKTINDPSTPNIKRLQLFASLDKDTKKEARIDRDGNLTTECKILIDGPFDTGNTKMIEFINSFINNYNNLSDELKLKYYKIIPGGHGNTVPYRDLIPQEYQQEIKQKLRRQYTKRFIKILKNSIDAPRQESLTLLSPSNEKITYDTFARGVTSTKNLEALKYTNKRNSRYGSNKYTQNLEAKIRMAFVRMCKKYLSKKLTDVNFNINPYLDAIIQKGIDNTTNAKRITNSSIVVPYGYLLSLYDSEDTEKQEAFYDFIYELVDNDLYHAPQNEEDVQIYDDMKYSVMAEKYKVKLFGKYKTTVDKLLSNTRTDPEAIEERKKLHNSLPLEIRQKLSVHNNEIMTINKDYMDSMNNDKDFENDNEINDDLATNQISENEAIKKTIKTLTGDDSQQNIDNIIKLIKKHLFFTDSEWEERDLDLKIEDIVSVINEYKENSKLREQYNDIQINFNK